MTGARVCQAPAILDRSHAVSKAPANCHRDPQPGQGAGAWRCNDTNAVYDPKAAERARAAALRRTETTRTGRRENLARLVQAGLLFQR